MLNHNKIATKEREKDLNVTLCRIPLYFNDLAIIYFLGFKKALIIVKFLTQVKGYFYFFAN